MPRQKILMNLALFATLALGAYLMYDFIIALTFEGEQFSDGGYFAIANLFIMYIALFEVLVKTQIQSGRAFLILLVSPFLFLLFIWAPVVAYTWNYVETDPNLNPVLGFLLYGLVPLAPAGVYGLIAHAISND